jgi:hypothetical protein
MAPHSQQRTSRSTSSLMMMSFGAEQTGQLKGML